MSHVTRVKTQFRDTETLVGVLVGMGKKVQRGGTIRVWGGRRLPVDIAVDLPGQYDLGFVRNRDGYYYVVQEAMSVGSQSTTVAEVQRRGRTIEDAKIRENERLERVRQEEERKHLEELERQARRAYALATTLRQLDAQGFDVVEHIEENDGRVRLVARRWA